MASGFRSLLCQESFSIPLLIYAALKLIRPFKTENKIFKLCLITVYAVVSAILTVLMAIYLLLCAVYFELTKCIAICLYGDDFHGAFIGADVVWSHDLPECRCNIHILFLFENQVDTPKKMMQFFTDEVFQSRIVKNHPRLACLRKYFMGYFYFIHTKVDFAKVATYIDDYNTIEEFHVRMNEITTKDLPYNNELLWEVKIGRKPVKLATDKFQYPVIIRYHHSISDGITLTAFLLTSYANNGINQLRSTFDKYSKCFNKTTTQKLPNRMLKILNVCKEYTNNGIFFHYNFLTGKSDRNSLHQKLSGQKMIFFSLGMKDYLEKIKAVKRILNVAFGDVILAVIAASFTDYFNKYDNKDKITVKQILSSNPYFLKVSEIDKIVTINDKGEAITSLGNKFSVGYVELPIDNELLQEPLAFIRRMNETTRLMKQSMDFILMNWLFNVIGSVVPKWLSEPIVKLFDTTAIITNVPGVDQISFLNGCVVENMFVWTNNFKKIGISITLFSYNNNFCVTLHMDAALVKDNAHCKELTDNIIKYINVFHERATKVKNI